MRPHFSEGRGSGEGRYVWNCTVYLKPKNGNLRRNVHSDRLLVCCKFIERKFDFMEKQDKRINSDRFSASAFYIFVLFYLVYWYIETTLGIESQFKKDIIKRYTPTWFRYAFVS